MTEQKEIKKRQRSCVGCRQQGDKNTLYRIVRNAQSGVSFDPSGKLPGRGAYVCSEKCLMDMYGSKQLDKALRTRIDKETYKRLCTEFVRSAKVEK